MGVQALEAEPKAIARASVQVWGIAESSPKLIGDVKTSKKSDGNQKFDQKP